MNISAEIEFNKLIDEYWELASSCYDQILIFMKTPDYEPNGRVPGSDFIYSHHGCGFTIFLDSGIHFDLDFHIKKLAGLKPYFVFNYLSQVKNMFPELANLTDLEIEDLFREMVREGKLDKHPYESLYKRKDVSLEEW